MSFEERYNLSLDIAEGLRCLHDNHLVHGDLKPDNILIFMLEHSNIRYTAKLSDFGFCLPLENADNLSFDSYRGTERWRPPETEHYEIEQHGKFEPDALLKCDSYSYGLVVLSTMFTNGHFPFGSCYVSQTGNALEKSKALLKKQPELNSVFQKALEQLCKRVLCKRPCDRERITPALLASPTQDYYDWQVLAHWLFGLVNNHLLG